MPNSVDEKIGFYEILARIGMAEVYRAHDFNLRSGVARLAWNGKLPC